jgi:hypothetical protein
MIGPNLPGSLLHQRICAVGVLRLTLVSSIVHNSHTDLIFEFSSPLFSRGIFSRLAPLSYLVFDGLEANVLEPCSCAWDDENSTVA